MLDERRFITRIEAAGATEFARLIGRPSADEERVLRLHFGDAGYARLRRLALMPRRTRGGGARGNVIVLHGITGGELVSVAADGDRDPVWLNVPRIVFGGVLERLRLEPDGVADADPRWRIEAGGPLKRWYGEILLALGADWEVSAFAYDWRKSVDLAARALAAQIDRRFGADAPVHLVAHSMGGLVARSFIKQFPGRWATMADADGRGGRLVMLGTPNHGSFAIPRLIAGIEDTVNLLALADLGHSKAELQRIFNSFPGSLEMLPSPRVLSEADRLYDATTWGGGVRQAHLDAARRHHDWLADVVDPARMVYVAGYDQPTAVGLADPARAADPDAYEWSLAGDGRVPHRLGFLATAAGDPVPTFFVAESHGSLQQNPTVFAALGDLLRAGRSDALADRLPDRRGAKPEAVRTNGASGQEAVRLALQRDLAELRRRDGRTRGDAGIAGAEARIEALLPSGWLGAATAREPAASPTPTRPGPRRRRGRLVLRVTCGDLVAGEDLAEPPVDALAVGHYRGVPAQGAELAIDRAWTAGFGAAGPDGLLLTQLTRRGVVGGDLGQIFLLPEPPGHRDRLAAFVGLGASGHAGVPEVSAAVRELAWTLGQLGRRHLASVLIGGGAGNLAVDDAARAWWSGLAAALRGAPAKGRLEAVTLVEADPLKALLLDRALAELAQREYPDADDGPPDFHYAGLAGDRDAFAATARRQARRDAERTVDARLAAGSEAASTVPTRLCLELDPDNTYRFSAITGSASVPERSVRLDPRLVAEANDELAAAQTKLRQSEGGRLLGQLLIPADLQPHLGSEAPLVLELDATTARIHWEMLAQPDPLGGGEAIFLGVARSLTRQLRTAFAPAPEPPPQPERTLRVLLVADPAEDMPLAGAQVEGQALADLFAAFNAWPGNGGNRITVTALFGPAAATRTAVLRELMLREPGYDVLHFAGHCAFDAADPAASGWIFGHGERLTARELTRLPRVPPFVFSNACESGVTPDRAGSRSAALAPSFAEAFFARGVADFVCTAWPVGDLAALDFARTLYACLLGLVEDDAGRWQAAPTDTLGEMHEAMRCARQHLFARPDGLACWGAYQHYGDPGRRLFARRGPA